MSLAKSAHAMASIPIRLRKLPLIVVPLFTIAAHDLRAQTPTTSSPSSPTSVCGMPIPAPAKLPPAGSGPIVYVLIPCFEKQGGASVVEAQTYLYYMNVRPSLPSQDKWVPYDSSTEQTLKEDFKRLWATSFLDDLDDRGEGLHLHQWRDRQDRHLSHGRTAAREDRRLRRLEGNRADEDRRETARRERPGADGFVHQRRLDPPHESHHPLDALREGLSR